MVKKSQFHKPQYNYKLKTLIIGASGKIGKYLLEFGNNNYIYTYNKRKIYKGIHFDITKNNLNRFCEKFTINKIVLLSGISDPDECYKKRKYSNLINVTNTKKIIDYIIKKDIYNTVGGFNENVRAGEDIEWRERLEKQGLLVGTPEASLLNYKGLKNDIESVIRKYFIALCKNTPREK